MSYRRKIEWLNNKHIYYRQDPINDKPTFSTDTYDYYEKGTHEYYNLFNTKSKITTYKSLKWHLLVLYYLNMDNPYFDLIEKVENDHKSNPYDLLQTIRIKTVENQLGISSDKIIFIRHEECHQFYGYYSQVNFKIVLILSRYLITF